MNIKQLQTAIEIFGPDQEATFKDGNLVLEPVEPIMKSIIEAPTVCLDYQLWAEAQVKAQAEEARANELRERANRPIPNLDPQPTHDPMRAARLGHALAQAGVSKADRARLFSGAKALPGPVDRDELVSEIVDSRFELHRARMGLEPLTRRTSDMFRASLALQKAGNGLVDAVESQLDELDRDEHSQAKARKAEARERADAEKVDDGLRAVYAKWSKRSGSSRRKGHR